MPQFKFIPLILTHHWKILFFSFQFTIWNKQLIVLSVKTSSRSKVIIRKTYFFFYVEVKFLILARHSFPLTKFCLCSMLYILFKSMGILANNKCMYLLHTVIFIFKKYYFSKKLAYLYVKHENSIWENQISGLSFGKRNVPTGCILKVNNLVNIYTISFLKKHFYIDEINILWF